VTGTAAIDREAASDGVGAERRARTGLRIGIDVGGTFTKAVAIAPVPFELVADAVVPTSHGHSSGVDAGIATALEQLLGGLGRGAGDVQLVAFSTTQAMNALLEGDVPRVGIVGLGAKPDLRRARKRTRVGSVGLAPGRRLATEHAFVDVTGGLDDAAAAAALDRLLAAGCEAVAVSGAFAVESPELELRVAALAADRGVPVCCGHQLSGAYGLETRTLSAAVNAAILPAVERAAGLVEGAMASAGIEAPLLVLRGDAGAMDVSSFRSRPSFTVGSGPAAGVAAALHRTEVGDGIVLECGGTSTNVSAVVGGRPVLRSIKVMGRPTAIRSIDSWVVGVAGGSMLRLGRRGIAGVGPRSAHGAGLPYACFTPVEQLRGAALASRAPRPGDPGDYAVLEGPGGRFAVTATCAANALGRVPAAAHAAGSRESAQLAFAAVGAATGLDPGELAEAAHAAAVEQLRATVEEAARAAGLGPDAPLIALGGAAEALGPQLSELCGRELVRPEHPEVLASVGAALTLIRVELERSARAVDPDGRQALVRAAEIACLEAGAAPGTIAVEVRYDADAGLLRAAASGSVALERGAAERRPRAGEELHVAAARALSIAPEALRAIAESDFFAAYSTAVGDPEPGRAAIVDRLGGVVFAGEVKAVVAGRGEEFVAELAAAVDAASLNLGLGSLLPAVTLVAGSHVLDLADARDREALLRSAQQVVADTGESAVAVVVR